MSTGKQIAARVAAECGGVKPWTKRISPGYSGVSYVAMEAMQAEIDELRIALQASEHVQHQHAENVLWQASRIAELQAENARLLDALETIQTATACSYAKNIARAALGES